MSFLKTAIASIAVAATVLAAMPAADAAERWHRHHRHSRNDGDLAVAGLLGLAAGALIVGLASRPVYREPVYVDPRPGPHDGYATRYAGPDTVYVDDPDIYVDDYASLEPWTPQWFAYCSDRYRSFNGDTGTFTGYDGQQHFCVAN